MPASRRLPRILFLLVVLPALGGCFAVIAGGAVAGANAARDRRGAATVIEDRRIQIGALDSLNKDKQLVLKNNVSVVVYDGVMLLVGEVRSEELKARAEERVSGFEGVRRLINELEVREPEGFWSRRRDDALTGQVKTALLDIVDLPGFDPTRVNVTSAHRVVYLMGKLSHEEAERVVEIARNVDGVERVVKVFDYTD